ncbi:Uncharacterised protein [uncultured archaeon]|nr:Uncharacterised protein [uncultured archaeon]
MVSARLAGGLKSIWRNPHLIENPDTAAAVLPGVTRIVTRKARPGKRIILNSLSSVPQNQEEKTLLESVRRRLNMASGRLGTTRQGSGRNTLAQKEYNGLLAKERVLSSAISLGEALGGRKPSIYQALAKIGLLYGFDSAEIREASKKMAGYAATKNNQSAIPWVGAVTATAMAIKTPANKKGENYPTALEKMLYGRKESMTGLDMARKLGVQWSHESATVINAAMQLLETAGFAKKLPEYSTGKTGGTFTVWSHRAHRSSLSAYVFRERGITHYRNPQMEILNQLMNGPMETNRLYRQKKIMDGKQYFTGNTDAIFPEMTVYDAVGKLQRNGLVRISEGKYAGGYKAREKIPVVDLTKDGQRLWAKSISRGNLEEKLRLLMAGEKMHEKK